MACPLPSLPLFPVYLFLPLQDRGSFFPQSLNLLTRESIPSFAPQCALKSHLRCFHCEPYYWLLHKDIFPIKYISDVSGHIGAISGIWRIKGVVFQSLKWNHMGSCLPIRLALDLTHVMGIWLINGVFQSYAHWPLDPAQRGHCFSFTNEVDFGFFLPQLEMCYILFLFKSLKLERTKLSETPAAK